MGGIVKVDSVRWNSLPPVQRRWVEALLVLENASVDFLRYEDDGNVTVHVYPTDGRGYIVRPDGTYEYTMLEETP